MWSPDTAWPDSWVLIGAMASITRRLRFSNAVYVAPARPPAGSRQTGGHRVGHFRGPGCRWAVGAGWMREEFDLMGQDFGNRGKAARRDDPGLTCAVAGRLGCRGSGRYYQVPELMLEPHPTTPVPILCGGESEGGVTPGRPAVRRVGGHGLRLGRRGWLRPEADGVAARVRATGTNRFEIMLALLEMPSV